MGSSCCRHMLAPDGGVPLRMVIINAALGRRSLVRSHHREHRDPQLEMRGLGFLLCVCLILVGLTAVRRASMQLPSLLVKLA